MPTTILNENLSIRQNLEKAFEVLGIEWFFEMPLRQRKFKRSGEARFSEWSEEDHESARALIFEKFEVPNFRGQPISWKLGKNDYYDALLALSNGKQKCVLRDYFKSCEISERHNTYNLSPENWLSIGFGSHTTNYSKYVQASIWHGLLMRSFFPGWKIKMAPVLTGPSSIGKSPLVEHLLPLEFRKDYFVSGAEITGDIRDYGPLLLGKAIIELGEMAGLNRADENRIKQLIDSTSLSWTPKYQRFSQSVDHTFIFVGTANDDGEFLPANTIAAQRFAIQEMSQFQLTHAYPGDRPVEDWMNDVRDHLVAITYQQIMEKKYLELGHLPRYLKSAHVDATDEFRTRIDPELEEKVIEFATEEIEKDDFVRSAEGYSLTEIMSKINMDGRPSRHTAKMLRSLGFKKSKIKGQSRWFLPDESLTEDEEEF